MANIKHIGIDLSLKTNKDINDNFEVLNNADSKDKEELEQKISIVDTKVNNHIDSTNAHKSKDIIYMGDVPGANNAKMALDILKAEIDAIVTGGTDVDPRVSQALVDSEGTTYKTLKARNDAWEGKVNENSTKLNEHKLANMPHQAKDITNNKTYKFGLQIKDGVTQIICEEVV